MKLLTTLSKLSCRKTQLLSTNGCYPCLRRLQNFERCTIRYSSSDKAGAASGPKEVYYGALTPQVFGVKIFSLTTSMGGLAAQPILYQQISQAGSMSLVIGVATVIGFFTFATPFLLHMLTRKYVTHILYDESKDCYTATFISFFLTKKKISFTPADIEVPDIPGMFTSFHIKGAPVFVDGRLFSDPAHYARIMGFDKPMDFKLADISEKMAALKKEEATKK